MVKHIPARLKTTCLAILLACAATAQTTLPTSWNFSAPGIATPPTGWTTGLGTNGNLTYSFGVGDALSCRFDATGEYLLIQFTDKPGPLSYYLSPQNAGAAWGGQFDIQESANGSSWTTVRSITTKATTATNFTNGKYTDNLQSTSRYIRFYYTTKLPGGQPTPGGNMALDSVLIRQAPASPEASLQLKEGPSTIISNSTYVVNAPVSTTVSHTFTVANKGTADTLFVSGISLTGQHASDFGINGPTVFKVAPNGSATFNLTFQPTASGSRFAQLIITSNDTLKNPYTVNLYGIGGNYATEPAAAAGALQFANVKAYGFTGAFAKASVAPEGYLVLRSKDAAVTDTPMDGHTYLRGDYIGSAQVAYAGTDTFFSPTYIFAGTGYHFAVFTFNGPAGFENYRTAGAVKGNVTTAIGNPGTYYSGLNPQASDFVTKLSQKINPHDTVFYSLYIARVVNNYLTRDTTGGKKVVNCVYTRLPYSYDEPFVWWNGSNSGTLTREHTYAQSWMPSNQGSSSWPNDPVTGKELPEYNDLHHLFPADQVAGNQKRSNYPFGEIVGAPTYVSSTGFGKLGKDSTGNTIWEPGDEHKGDLARALFYMVTCYNGINGKLWALPSGQDQAVLKKWHFQDPPDAFELARHEMIYDAQHNRNPFIDNPSFACRINFSNMTWIATPTGNCATAQLTVTYPNTGYINVGDVFHLPIAWTSNLVDSVKIDCQVNDTGIVHISAGVPATPGNYNWSPIPANLFGDSLRIIITDKNNASLSGQSVKFMLDAASGVKRVSAPAGQVLLYPNPATGKVNLVFSGMTGMKTIRVLDITGKQLQEVSTPDDSYLLPLEHTGLLIFCFENQNQLIFTKLISR